MSASPRHLRPLLAAALATVALAAAACSSSGYRYVKNSSIKTYFRVPESWELYDQETLVSDNASISPQRAERSRQTEWLVAFDGAPKPSLDHILDEQTRHPMGFVRVRALQADEREAVSIQTMRNEAVKLDQLAMADRVEPIRMADVVRPGGLHGIHEVHNIKAVGGGFLTIDQTVLVDPETRLIYLIVVGCEAKCYLDNKKVIDDVVRSWTIKER